MPRGIPRSKEAKHNPVILSNAMETAEQEIAQGNARILKSTGSGKDALDQMEHQIICDRAVNDEQVQMLAFMNEPVTIRIATTTDKDADQVFELNINSRLEFFRRGETKTVPRYFVDRLLRLKQTVYTQREVTNQEGVKDILHDPHTALKYDFSIVRDANPIGQMWEKSVLAEAG